MAVHPARAAAPSPLLANCPAPCRSAIPVVTCLLAVPVERQGPTRREALALGVLTAGVMLAVWQGRVAGTPRAVLLCLAGTACSGAMMTLSGRLLT